MVLRERIELSTSPLPRECSTTELPQRRGRGFRPTAPRAQEGESQKIAFRHSLPIARGWQRRRWTQAGKGANRESMTKTPNDPKGDAREARLKAALRANLARRKAQGRARAGTSDETTQNEQHGPEIPPNGQAPGNEE